MNKKIYFDTKFILITDGVYQPSENQLIVNIETETTLSVTERIKNFIQQNDKNNLILLSKNVLETFDLIKKEFKPIDAAGGLIKNSGRYLFIFRLKKWDLPKGKTDVGETIMEAAIRECEEECGVTGLKILDDLETSYHIYPYKGSYALKTTYWFLMETAYSGALVPQANENIEKAEWFTKEQVQSVALANTYPAISDILSEHIK